MPKATDSAEPYDASTRPRKPHGQDKPIVICGLDGCEWNSTDQSTVSRHKWTHLPRSMYPCCDALDLYGKRCGRRYFRLDDYKTHWKKCHKNQEWVNPEAKERFTSLWQEYCKQRNKRQFLTTLSPSLQQAPSLAFPQAPSMDIIPSPSPLPPVVGAPAVPMRLTQATPQVVLGENSSDLFGGDFSASAAPLPDANVPFLILPPSAYNYPTAPFSFPSASDYTGYSRVTPVGTTASSQSSSASTPSVPIPRTEDAFISIETNHQLQAHLEPFGGLAPDFQAGNQDWSEWLADSL